MSEPICTENLASIHSLFFGRLADNHSDLVHALAELARQIDGQNMRGVFDGLNAIDGWTQGMRNLSILFDAYTEKHQQLITSLNPEPKEGL